jgi:hypothetical protein
MWLLISSQNFAIEAEVSGDRMLLKQKILWYLGVETENNYDKKMLKRKNIIVFGCLNGK